MAFPPASAKDEEPATAFRPLSDDEFARLSTEDKFRHIRLGMLDLARALADWAPGAPGGPSHGE